MNPLLEATLLKDVAEARARGNTLVYRSNGSPVLKTCCLVTAGSYEPPQSTLQLDRLGLTGTQMDALIKGFDYGECEFIREDALEYYELGKKLREQLKPAYFADTLL